MVVPPGPVHGFGPGCGGVGYPITRLKPASADADPDVCIAVLLETLFHAVPDGGDVDPGFGEMRPNSSDGRVLGDCIHGSLHNLLGEVRLKSRPIGRAIRVAGAEREGEVRGELF